MERLLSSQHVNHDPLRTIHKKISKNATLYSNTSPMNDQQYKGTLISTGDPGGAVEITDLCKYHYVWVNLKKHVTRTVTVTS